ncbi:MAG: AAA family ATPase [Nocardioidaceae bacterium]
MSVFPVDPWGVEPAPEPADDEPPFRRVTLTAASSIAVRPVKWLWTQRLALGTLALLGGREGIGKSTIAYTLTADITRGRLPGECHAKPRAVIVAATEDSWSHTIVPRLMAAGADLDRVYRVDVNTYDGTTVDLILPRDLRSLDDAVRRVDAALILLDPLMSRLDAKLDTHKDAQVRQALEPLVRVADASGAAILGLIHVNKSASTDALTTLMASRAFAAVARAVLFVMVDPDDETTRLLGQPKNNLGRTDLPTLTFRIESAHVTDTDEGPVWTGRVHWLGETSRSIQEALSSASEPSDARSATKEAAEWLVDHLTSQGGTDDSATIKAEGRKAGHSEDCLKRARRDHVRATVESVGFPRRTFWTLPGYGHTPSGPVGASTGESSPTALTTLTAPTGPSVGAVSAVGAVRERRDDLLPLDGRAS